ncbi:TIGR04076 family protein [Candidatus Bathyarchaeota archaeon]|nr:TIGR04076 family protein [Candidatus Bathyarchaeota archaeon]
MTATIKEIRGVCPLYKVGDRILFESFYVRSEGSKDLCIHAFAAMSTLLSAFLHGKSATDLGIGVEPDIGYIQCPDPGPPCTKGGTVIFELRREAKG